MMKFLYGLVLLVATIPLSAANPTVGFAVFINRVVSNEDDCTDVFMAEVWSAHEDASVYVRGACSCTIVRLQRGIRALRGGLGGA